MSETQRTLFNRRVSGLLIAGAFLLLVTLFFAFLTPPISESGSTQWTRPATFRETQSVKGRELPAERRVYRTPQSVFDSEAFYRTIINNNLFRPLGWTPPRPIEPYRLLGTKLASDETTPPQAILQSTTGHQTYIVTLGSNLDADTEVVDIQSKQVTLSTQGQHRTLMLPSGF